MINAHDVPGWLDALAWVSIALGVISATVIAVDILSGRKQKMAVMNLVWPITGLYFGPVALWSYWRFGRGGQDTGDRGNKPFLADDICRG